MQVEKISEKELSREYNVTVPAGDISKGVDNKLTQLRKKLKVPGFRPGKVPLAIVKKSHGKNVLGEVLDNVIKKSSVEAIKKEGLRPASTPKIEVLKFEEGSDLQYKMEVEILPEVPTIDFSKIKLERPKVEVSKENIHEGIKKIASQHKHFHPVERAAKNGDAVKIDFKGFIGDEVFPGGEAQGHQLELGSNSFIEGFEEQLEGVKAGDEKDVNVTFSKEYHAENLAGKDAKFEIKVHEVLEVETHEKFDDEFAKHLGLESLEKLEEALKTQIESEVNSTIRMKMKKQLFDFLDDNLDFQIPAQMKEMELKSVVGQVKQATAMNPDSEDANKSDEDLEKEYSPMAERRVRLGIFLSDIGTKNNLAVTQNEIREAISMEASRYPGQEKQVIDHYMKNPAQLDNLRGPLLEEKVVDFIMEKASITDKETTLEDLRKEDSVEEESEANEPKKKSGGKKATSAKGKKADKK